MTARLLTTGLAVSVAVAVCAGPGAERARATPIYAIRSANACDTCHIEPLGWYNPEDVSERTCSLDCSSCHVSPTGGGLRTPAGKFYGREVLPMFGERPSAHADPSRYREEGAPDEGRFRLFEGFSGWWPGSTWHGDIEERYGDIDPDPSLVVGGDGRLMVYAPTDGRDAAIFPMQASLYGHWRPSWRWSVYTNAGLYSSRSGLDLLPEEARLQRDALDYLAVRELFVKADRLPYKAWARIGRFAPAYGWRIPDHTTFVRRNLGFDHDRGVYGVEAGVNPNYPYASAAAFVQGLDGWPGDTGDRAVGASLTAGIRELGWQLGGNAHLLRRPEGADELLLGAQWGLNLYPVTLLGEWDIRRLSDAETQLVSYAEADWLLARGLTGKLKYDWMDPGFRTQGDHFHRITVGADVVPYTQTEIELQYRVGLSGGGAAFVGSTVDAQEIVVMTHAWF